MWYAEAKAGDSDEAIDCVKRFKPTGFDVTETIEEHPETSSAKAEWTWEIKTAKTGIKYIHCEVNVTPGGPDYIVDKQVGEEDEAGVDVSIASQQSPAAAPPVLHEARRDAAEIRVSYEIVAYDRAAIVPPTQHLVESAELVRAPKRENTMAEPAILDEKEGTYVWRMEEFYLFTGTEIPQIVHDGDHHLIQPATPPGKGSVGN